MTTQITLDFDTLSDQYAEGLLHVLEGFIAGKFPLANLHGGTVAQIEWSTGPIPVDTRHLQVVEDEPLNVLACEDCTETFPDILSATTHEFTQHSARTLNHDHVSYIIKAAKGTK